MKLSDSVLRPGGLALTRRLAAQCAFRPGAKVVDIGCGTGITVEYLRTEYGLDAVGIDLAAAQLRRGRERLAGLPLLQAVGEELPFADQSVDGVLAECSLSVMADAGRVLAECSRVLVPRGKLALTDVYVREAHGLLPAGNGGISGIMNGDELTALLSASGFRIIIWEDHTALWKEFVAAFIMEHGSVTALWQCLAYGGGQTRPPSKAARLGYFLLVAEKTATEP